MPKNKLLGCGLPASTLKQFIDLSYDSNNNQSPAGYTIDKALSDSRVKVYKSNKNSNVIVVHRGSAALSDWIDNALYATTGNVKSSGTYKQHKKKQDAAIAKYGANNIISVGHSRGAKYAEELNKENPVKEVITYNKAAGFHDVRQKNPANQTDVKTSRDIVSLLTPLQQSSNKVITIPQKTLNPHTAHMTSALDELGDQNLGLEGGSVSGRLIGGMPFPPNFFTDKVAFDETLNNPDEHWDSLREPIIRLWQDRWDSMLAKPAGMTRNSYQNRIRTPAFPRLDAITQQLIDIDNQQEEYNKRVISVNWGSGYGGGPKQKAKPTIPPPLDLDVLRSDAFTRNQSIVGESSDAGMNYELNYEIPLSTSRGDFSSRGREKKPSIVSITTPRAKIRGIPIKPSASPTPVGLEISNLIESQFNIADDGSGAVYDKDDNSLLGYWNPVFHYIQDAPLVPSIRPVVGLLSTGKLDFWIEGIKEQGDLTDEQLQKILNKEIDIKNPFMEKITTILNNDIEKILHQSNEYVNNINTTYWAQPSKVRDALLKAKKVYALNPSKTIAQENELLLTKFYRTAFNYLIRQVAAKEDFYSKPIEEDDPGIWDGESGGDYGIIPQEYIDDNIERAVLDLFTIAEPQFTIGGKMNNIFLSGIPLYKDVFVPVAMSTKTNTQQVDAWDRHPTKLFWDGNKTFNPNREATLRELVIYLIHNYWRNLDAPTREKYATEREDRIEAEADEEEEEDEEEESDDPNEELYRRYATSDLPAEGSGFKNKDNFRQQYINSYRIAKRGGGVFKSNNIII